VTREEKARSVRGVITNRGELPRYSCKGVKVNKPTEKEGGD
jgi:hypothetical protein